MLQDTSNAVELLYLGSSGLQFDTTLLCKTEHGLLFWPTLVTHMPEYHHFSAVYWPWGPLDHSI